MTDIIVKIIEDDPSQYAEGISSQEQILKDCGMSLPEIKAYMAENLPPPPTPPEEVERRRQMQEQLEALEKAEAERERLEKLKQSDPEAYEREMNPKAGLLINRFSFCLTFVKEQTLYFCQMPLAVSSTERQIVSSPIYSEIASLSVAKCCPFRCSQQGPDGSQGRLQSWLAARLDGSEVTRRQHPARGRREAGLILRGGSHPESHRGHGH